MRLGGGGGVTFTLFFAALIVPHGPKSGPGLDSTV